MPSAARHTVTRWPLRGAIQPPEVTATAGMSTRSPSSRSTVSEPSSRMSHTVACSARLGGGDGDPVPSGWWGEVVPPVGEVPGGGVGEVATAPP
ncbi:hypothetical protein C1701_06370 [Actinoalloteichus sp. AHMU CJ021]|nr:hypothetical protein C1701_06370 [Actinoalloteichus sp. AHMU CJ021]